MAEDKTPQRSGIVKDSAEELQPSSPPALQPFAWVVGLMQVGDSFYPTGSYAHSFGLEGLVQEGVVHDRATLKAFFELSAMPALRQVELPLAAHSWRAFGEADWVTVGELCVLSSALKTAREARMASDNIGRQRTELMGTLRQHPLAVEFMRRAAVENWPFSSAIAAALEGRVFGAPLPAVLGGIYYASVASLLSAAMKLLRLGQNASQSLLTETLAGAPSIIAAAQQVKREDIGWFNPWLDIAAARHERADSRMFIS
jgi:urease accessory protein